MKMAIKKLATNRKFHIKEIGAIGISYQMHGLVVVDKNQQMLRDAIIWCDSRAVKIGEKAFSQIGEKRSLSNLLNSPGNFTAAKLGWLKENELDIYAQIDKIMLPGDYIAMKMSHTLTTSTAALSEGIFWDFKHNEISKDVMQHFDFDYSLIPEIKDLFSTHGTVSSSVAKELGLAEKIPITYKAGDQPNNALSLNVLKPGEVAATAGTSGVIYGVSDQLIYDEQSRVNTFAHVNHTAEKRSLGVLLCVNGTGILNRWIKNLYQTDISYQTMNELAKKVAPGSEGLSILPFGNGAERVLNNANVGAHIHNLNFNRHQQGHLFRAAQEGIAFSMNYGLEILRENGIKPSVIRAGSANMFLSEVFTHCFVNATGVPVELYDNDGSVGAAIGAGMGVKVFNSSEDAFTNFKPKKTIEPNGVMEYKAAYNNWKELLKQQL